MSDEIPHIFSISMAVKEQNANKLFTFLINKFMETQDEITNLKHEISMRDDLLKRIGVPTGEYMDVYNGVWTDATNKIHDIEKLIANDKK